MTESERGVSSPPLFEIEQLKKNYWLDDHEIQVLRGVDLKIRAGERMSIIGPSGSGKSTFLHVLGTLDVPTQGTVKFRVDDDALEFLDFIVIAVFVRHDK